MRFQLFTRTLLPLLAALALAACHHEEAANTPGGGTPEAAVQQSIALIKTGDFAGFWKQSLPPADYANLRADWVHTQPQKPITDEDRARFTQAMQQLTAPNAETTLYAQLQPKLTQLDQQYHDQVPVLIGIGQAIVSTGIAQNKNLTEGEKQQARDALSALLPWAQQTAWFDQDKAKQAVGVVVTTARQLDLKSPDQLVHMDFDSAMAKYSQAFGGIKQLLSIYGLSVDDTFNSAKVSTLSTDANGARVKIDYTLLGKPLSTESQVEQIDGRWYSKDLVTSVRNAHQQALHPAPAATAPAPMSSAPAPASTTSPTVTTPKVAAKT